MFFWNSLPFRWSNRCWQFDLWFLYLFQILLEHLDFMVHILLKPGLENFEHYFASMWDECNCSLSILWHCLSLGLEWKLISSSPVATAEFSRFAGILSAALSQRHLLGFEIGQLGSPSPSLALFVVMTPKAHLTSHSSMLGSRWVITPSWLSGSWRFFFYIVLLCILATSS